MAPSKATGGPSRSRQVKAPAGSQVDDDPATELSDGEAVDQSGSAFEECWDYGRNRIESDQELNTPGEVLPDPASYLSQQRSRKRQTDTAATRQYARVVSASSKSATRQLSDVAGFASSSGGQGLVQLSALGNVYNSGPIRPFPDIQYTAQSADSPAVPASSSSSAPPPAASRAGLSLKRPAQDNSEDGDVSSNEEGGATNRKQKGKESGKGKRSKGHLGVTSSSAESIAASTAFAPPSPTRPKPTKLSRLEKTMLRQGRIQPQTALNPGDPPPPPPPPPPGESTASGSDSDCDDEEETAMFQYLESLDEAGQLLQAGGRSTVRLGGYGPLGSGASNALIEDQRLKDVAEWEVARRDSDGKLGLSGGALLAVQASARHIFSPISATLVQHINVLALAVDALPKALVQLSGVKTTKLSFQLISKERKSPRGDYARDGHASMDAWRRKLFGRGHGVLFVHLKLKSRPRTSTVKAGHVYIYADETVVDLDSLARSLKEIGMEEQRTNAPRRGSKAVDEEKMNDYRNQIPRPRRSIMLTHKPMKASTVSQKGSQLPLPRPAVARGGFKVLDQSVPSSFTPATAAGAPVRPTAPLPPTPFGARSTTRDAQSTSAGAAPSPTSLTPPAPTTFASRAPVDLIPPAPTSFRPHAPDFVATAAPKNLAPPSDTSNARSSRSGKRFRVVEMKEKGRGSVVNYSKHEGLWREEVGGAALAWQAADEPFGTVVVGRMSCEGGGALGGAEGDEVELLQAFVLSDRGEEGLEDLEWLMEVAEEELLDPKVVMRPAGWASASHVLSHKTFGALATACLAQLSLRQFQEDPSAVPSSSVSWSFIAATTTGMLEARGKTIPAIRSSPSATSLFAKLTFSSYFAGRRYRQTNMVTLDKPLVQARKEVSKSRRSGKTSTTSALEAAARRRPKKMVQAKVRTSRSDKPDKEGVKGNGSDGSSSDTSEEEDNEVILFTRLGPRQVALIELLKGQFAYAHRLPLLFRRSFNKSKFVGSLVWSGTQASGLATPRFTTNVTTAQARQFLPRLLDLPHHSYVFAQYSSTDIAGYVWVTGTGETCASSSFSAMDKVAKLMETVMAALG